MIAFLYYCLKVIFCSGILYGYYLLALRNHRFHQWNRWYLLGSVVLAFGLPFLQIPLPDFSERKTAIAYSVELLATPDFYFAARPPQALHFTWVSAVMLAYTGVVFLLLFLFLKNLRTIQVLKQRYKEEIADGVHFYNTVEPGTPFSFFKNIFWNSGIDLHTAKGQQMLRHEMAHVQEWHSADKLLLEVATVLAFWNPFLYLIKKELSVVHEFIADRRATANHNQLEYASLLLMKALGSPQYALGNPFFHSQLKRRIMMLTRSKNPRFTYFRRLLVLPLAVLSLILFSFKYKEIKEGKEKNADSVVYLTDPGEEQFFDDQQDTTKKQKIAILSKEKYKGSLIKIITPTDDRKGIIVKTVDGNTYFLDRKEAATALNIKITDKEITADNMVFYDSNGVPPDMYNNLEVITNKPADTESIIRLQDPATGNFIIRGDTSRQPLYILEGMEISPQAMKAIDPSKIKAVNVLKGESAITKYGQKGRNGVVEITLLNTLPDNVLYMLDGVESTKEKVQAINPANVNGVTVWKGEEALKRYGEKGLNGVVEMTTKLARNEVTFDNAQQPTIVIGHPSKSDTTLKKNSPGGTLKEVIVVGYGTKKDYDKIFTKVEEPATFPGGDEGWRRYLMRNFQYPEAARKNGTQGIVKVQLLVDEEGDVNEIKALNDPGDGLAEEAVRVIKSGPKWNPAKQNKRIVNYRFVQPIVFSLQ